MKTPVAAIEELVRAVAENAARDKVKLSEKTEALRVLAPYYATLTKHHPFQPDTVADLTTISGLQNAVRKAEVNNGRTVSDHQRRGRGEESAETVED